MSLKVLIITLVYQLVITEQRNVEKVALDYSEVQELQNLLKQLALQINKEHKVHKHIEKPKNKEVVAGNDVLNLLLQRDDDLDDDRSEDAVLKKYDRDCKSGRCGCSGPRCGNNRAESSSDEIVKLLDSLEKTIENDMDHGHTRCGGGRCGRDRNDDRLCKGVRCGGHRDDDDDVGDSLDAARKLARYGRTYNLNDQLDAVVVDAARTNEAIKELKKHCVNANCKFIDYSPKVSRTNDVTAEEDSINAVILDLTHLPEGNHLAKELNNAFVQNIKLSDPQREHLSPTDLDRYYQSHKRNSMIDVVDYMKGKNGRRETVKNLSGKQKHLVEDVKNLLLKGGIGLNDKQMVKQIEEILFGKHSPTKIYAHSERNRNIYVPKKLYNKIDKPNRDANLRVQKRLLPLTLKQRNRLQKTPLHLWRRNSSANYGLPFDMQVQGLGQVVA